MSAEAKNESVKLPFNVYDIFGYLIPGAFFIIISYFFDHEIKNLGACDPFLPVLHLIDQDISVSEESVIGSTLILSIFILIAYVIGHIIASISSHFLDKMLVEKGHGYPYQNLLFFEEQQTEEYRTRPLIKGSFFWMNFYLLIQCGSYIWGNDILHWVAKIMIYGILIYWVLSLIFWLSLKYNKVGPKTIKFYGLSLKVWVFIYDIVVIIYSKTSRTNNHLDSVFIAKYKNYFKSTFDYPNDKANTNHYWFSVMYVTEKSKTLGHLISNWLSLYSFARNLATCLFLLFIYMFISFMINNINQIVYPDSRIFYAPFIAYFGFMILLTRYYYLYKNYYSKFIFRSFVFLKELEARNRERFVQNK